MAPSGHGRRCSSAPRRHQRWLAQHPRSPPGPALRRQPSWSLPSEGFGSQRHRHCCSRLLGRALAGMWLGPPVAYRPGARPIPARDGAQRTFAHGRTGQSPSRSRGGLRRPAARPWKPRCEKPTLNWQQQSGQARPQDRPSRRRCITFTTPWVRSRRRQSRTSSPCAKCLTPEQRRQFDDRIGEALTADAK